jgi:hypothetical protein
MTSKSYMEKPCKQCPYRRDVKPFLTPERGEELADLAGNPFNDFPCHKTTEEDEHCEDGSMIATESSKSCAGFLTLLAAEQGLECLPEGFSPSFREVYSESWDMIGAYEDQGDR